MRIFLQPNGSRRAGAYRAGERHDSADRRANGCIDVASTIGLRRPVHLCACLHRYGGNHSANHYGADHYGAGSTRRHGHDTDLGNGRR